MDASLPGPFLVVTLGLLALWAPGLFVTRLAGFPGPRDPLVRLGIATAAGLAFWPLVLLASSLAGIRWTPSGARVLTAAVAVAAALLLAGSARFLHVPRYRVFLAAFAGIAALTAWTRVLHVRGLVLPAWVDSVHHQMIVQLVVARGGVPETWAPFLPDVPAVYHWGFHAGAAWVAWLAGAVQPLAVASVLLWYGQLLNALTPLVLYAAGRALFGSRNAGLLAATAGSLVSWFPAYYTAWGRYTQLCGLLLLPAVAILLAELARRPRLRTLAFSGLLVAGLLLVHVRVAFFAATLAAVLALPLARRQGIRVLAAWGAAAALGLVLVSPWLVRLALSRQPVEVLSPSRTDAAARWASYNSLPRDLLLAPYNRELAAVATVGVSGMAGWAAMPVLGRIASVALWVVVLASELRRTRRGARRRTGFPWQALVVLWGWALLTTLLVNLDAFGIPPLRIAPNSVLVISLFLPLALASGGVGAWLVRVASPLRRSALVGSAAALCLGGWGASRMRDVVPPWTILATNADLRALVWVERNTPPSAVFAVRARPWVAGTFAGLDGGYWLPLLTGRSSVLPPALYPSIPDAARRERLERFLANWAAATTLDDPGLREELREAGVTHLFVGEAKGLLMASTLAGRPFARRVYAEGPVAVFALDLSR